MSQRNPMNDRYMGEGPKGATRRSAASAKPKSQAASTVIIKSNKKTRKEIKAEEKERRRKAEQRQREIDSKYYKPDTKRYKNLRKIWIGCLVCAALGGVVMFLTGEAGGWLNIASVVVAYGFIIAAFYVDFSLIRRERTAYQERMLAIEAEETRKLKSHGGTVQGKATPKKVSKNASRNPKKQEEAARRNAEAQAAAEAEAAAEATKPKKRLFGFRKKDEKKASTDTASVTTENGAETLVANDGKAAVEQA